MMKQLAAMLAIALAAAIAVPGGAAAAQGKKPVGSSPCAALDKRSIEYKQCMSGQHAQAKQARQACAQYPKGSPQQRACLAQRQPPKAG